MGSDTERCYRHPERRAGVTCTRCGNVICRDCMVVAPVGHHCPSCVAGARADMRRVRTVRWREFGSPVPLGPVVGPLIAVNVCVFLYASTRPGAINTLANASAKVLEGEYWRLLSAAFAHSDGAHLVLNMLSLALIGPALATILGSSRFLALYVLAALGASVTTLLVATPASVGASGAVLGVLGALCVIGRSERMPVDRWVLLTVVYLVAGFAIPAIDGAGHVGGVVTGAALGAAFTWSRGRRSQVALDAAVSCAALVLLAGLVIVPSHGEEPGYATEEWLGEAELATLIDLGVPYEELLRQPVISLFDYQAFTDGQASYTVSVIQDPSRSRVLRIEFGDGSAATRTIPRGRGVEVRTFEHEFERRLARFEQRIFIVGQDETLRTTITDVCPGGPMPTTPPTAPGSDGGAAGMCRPLE